MSSRVVSQSGGTPQAESGSLSPAPADPHPPLKMARMLLSLASWFAFTLVLRLVGPDRVGWAGAAALAIAIVFLIVNAHGGLKILDVASVTTFGILTLVAFTGGPAVADVIADYGRGGCTLVLGAVMAVSVATVPFTEQYARESVPRQYWGSPAFRAVNRRLSLMWAVIVLIMSAGHLLDGYLDGVTAGSTRVVVDGLLNWVIPIAVSALGVHLTKTVVATRRAQVTHAADPR